MALTDTQIRRSKPGDPLYALQVLVSLAEKLVHTVPSIPSISESASP